MRATRLFLTFAGLAITACSSNGGPNALESTTQAMGGSEALQAVRSQRVVASGTWFEPEQTFQPGDAPRQVSAFRYTIAAVQ